MSKSDQIVRWRRLGLAMAAIAVIWGVVLPQLEKSPRVQARIRHLDGHGINPAAFFYSDHEGMNRWENAILRRLQRQPSRIGKPDFVVEVGSAATR